jgi:hypothetical protein
MTTEELAVIRERMSCPLSRAQIVANELAADRALDE